MFKKIFMNFFSACENNSLLRERDRNSVEIYDNVNTFPTQHPLAQGYI